MDNFKELERQANLITLKEEFINLLKKTNREGMDDLISYIESTDFFIAPASTRFHLCHSGGLLEHSINVYKRLEYKIKNDELFNNFNISEESIIITSLLHDLCKANTYEMAFHKVKKNDVWIDEGYYITNDQFPVGHGEKSVFLAMRYINLTDEEISAIRYHMGAFEESVINKITNVFSDNPLAFALHISDSEATAIIEKDK